MPELPDPRPKQKRLTKEEKEEVAKALAAGHKASHLAGQYGVSRQAISLIKRRMDAESGDAKAAEVQERRLSKLRTMKLTEEEWEKLSEKLKSSTPLEHKFAARDDYQPKIWDVERATRLARKLFNRTPARTRIIKLLDTLFPTQGTGRGSPHDKPKPPVRITKDTISPEFRDDPSYVSYVTSETYWKIQQRTHELELAEWERRQAGLPPRDEEEDEEPLPPMSFPIRPQKKPQKGPAFTKPKRRKKKKRK